MTTYDQLAQKIIKYEELIVSPVAWMLASKVDGLVIKNSENYDITVAGEPKKVINSLVAQYEDLFGRVGKMQCQDASFDLIEKMNSVDIPESLK